MSSGEPSEEQPQAPAPQFHVRCARELFEALESPDGTIRLAALHAVQDAPDTALGFGSYQERDLITVLLSQAKHFRGQMEWISWIGGLTAFHDPRVVELFASLITTESHAELLFAFANYLRTEPLQAIRAELSAALMQNECVARARAIASILAGRPTQSAGEALRIGLLEPGETTALPALSAASAEWLYELAGPFQLEAQLELRRQGPSTLATLVGHWEQLSESAQKWLLQWASDEDPDLVLAGIQDVFKKNSDELLLRALEAAATLKNVPADLDERITPILTHSDELIRRAAVLAYRSPYDWRLFFENESSLLVKQACIAKIVALEGPEAIPFALQQLAHPDWRIRAAAADGLLSLGESAVRSAFRLLPEADESVRVAIARMVIQLEDEELANEFVQCCSQTVGT